jgi:uncharacterized protein (TIGR02145 family)
LTAAYNFSTAVTSAITLYAKWVVKDFDGNVYTTVTIGTQTWLVQNLKTTHLNTGVAINNVQDSLYWDTNIPSYCSYANDAGNMSTYGALYNFYAIQTGNLAPAGWHVATEVEWQSLRDYLGGQIPCTTPMKDSVGWGDGYEGTNQSGFTALPGGGRYYYDGSFFNIGVFGGWWSSTEADATNAWRFQISNFLAGLSELNTDKSEGLSVRCVRNY